MGEGNRFLVSLAFFEGGKWKKEQGRRGARAQGAHVTLVHGQRYGVLARPKKERGKGEDHSDFRTRVVKEHRVWCSKPERRPGSWREAAKRGNGAKKKNHNSSLGDDLRRRSPEEKEKKGRGKRTRRPVDKIASHYRTLFKTRHLR